MGTILSDAIGAFDRSFPCGWHHGCVRSHDRSMVVGASRSTIYHRKPRRSGWQHRDRIGRARSAGRLYVATDYFDEFMERGALREYEFQFLARHRAGCERQKSAGILVVHPSFSAKSVIELIAYAKANPGAINMASGGVGTAQHV